HAGLGEPDLRQLRRRRARRSQSSRGRQARRGRRSRNGDQRRAQAAGPPAAHRQPGEHQERHGARARGLRQQGRQPDRRPIREAAHGPGQGRAGDPRERARDRHRPGQAFRLRGRRGYQGGLAPGDARRHGERPAHRRLRPRAGRAHRGERPAARASRRAPRTAGSPGHGAGVEVMNLSRFFIDRPIFAGVLSVLILLGGAISIGLLPVSEYPEVVPPSVVVRASYPGASPKVIAETVATPLEEQINGVENMLYMSSQATTDGLMTLTVTFRIGTNPDLAQQLVQNRVQQAEPRLPEEVRRLGVTTVKSAVDLTMVVHLVSPGERYDMTYLRNYGLLNVKDRLARIEGVGQVLMWGSGDYAMRVWLDPSKVAEHNLSANDVVQAIRGQNVQAAAGIVGASPAPDKTDLQLSINAQGRLQSEAEFGDIIVKTERNGAVTRLRDIARVELGASEYALRSLLDNKPAVAIGIFAAPGSNAIQISDNVRRTMADIKKN